MAGVAGRRPGGGLGALAVRAPHGQGVGGQRRLGPLHRRAQVHARQPFQHPLAAQDGPGLHRVGAEGEDRRQGQHPRPFLGREARRIEGQGLPPADRGHHDIDRAGDLGTLHALRARAVDGRGGFRRVAAVVGHQGRERAGAVEERPLDEQLGLDLHRVAHRPHDRRPLDVVVARGGHPRLDAEQRPEGAAGGRDEQDVVGAQPLVVEAHEGGAGLLVVEHPPRLGLDAGAGGERAGRGGGEQGVVGHRVPQEVGEARGQLPRAEERVVVVRPPARRGPEVERGRLQDARRRQRHRLVERTGGRVLAPEPFETAHLPGVEGPAVGAPGEAREARPRAGLPFGRASRRQVAAGGERRRDQGERREVHRRQMQFFHLVRRRRLSLGDALEPVRAGLRREPPGPRRRRRRGREDPPVGLAPGADAAGQRGPRRPPLAVAGEAEQVGDGVVVLGRGQGEGGGAGRGGAAAAPLSARGLRREGRGEEPGRGRRRDSVFHDGDLGPRRAAAPPEGRRPDRRASHG